MRVQRPDAHLTYCTNIHRGQTWAETFASLREHVPAVRRRLGVDRFAVGLRLSAAAAGELRASDRLDELQQWLQAEGLYVPTLNGFPHGAFHGTRVKEEVYRPDWSEPSRVVYTRHLADVLEQLLPPDAGIGSISTVPVCFGPRADEGRVQAAVQNLIEVAVDLWHRTEAGGPKLVVALEPEPSCHLETLAQTVSFFEAHLWSRAAIGRFARATGVSGEVAEQALREHLGVCLDTCHAAVEFEDPGTCVSMLQGAGISIGKIQLTAGLAIEEVDEDHVRALRAYDDEVYLHQVVSRCRHDKTLRRFVDIGEACAAFDAGLLQSGQTDWRVHFHIPVFTTELGPFSSTQSFLRSVLQEIRQSTAMPFPIHCEVETYTWDVLPEQLRTVEVDAAIARELQWVQQEWTS